ncbi:hypothetical protein H7U19_16385 [Hyunsoonleella sp. SJ7]|uniref:Uncharacterized protein n=1 Tax=Hyunsoonleella aquatilis TaxID=2762758 RepID=A0A923HKI1_9FLAO|nr:hypothetical protein [Hyunsoonleella aquatilis]MBC3759992.1 hypothetical protein [Hyunsoonleella aquatilis]
MKSVKSFIKALGENYYQDFLIDPCSDLVDYEEHFVLLKYKNKNYYEISLSEIKLRQEEILNALKKQYENALSQIYLKLSTAKTNTFRPFIKFNIDAVNIKIRTLKADMFIDSKRSRYFSILIDNFDSQSLTDLYTRDIDSNEYPEDGVMLRIFEKINDSSISWMNDSSESFYFTNFHYLRFQVLSWLPFALLHIANQFVLDLLRIEKYMNETFKVHMLSKKIKWLGKRLILVMF